MKLCFNVESRCLHRIGRGHASLYQIHYFLNLILIIFIFIYTRGGLQDGKLQLSRILVLSYRYGTKEGGKWGVQISVLDGLMDEQILST